MKYFNTLFFLSLFAILIGCSIEPLRPPQPKLENHSDANHSDETQPEKSPNGFLINPASTVNFSPSSIYGGVCGGSYRISITGNNQSLNFSFNFNFETPELNSPYQLNARNSGIREDVVTDLVSYPKGTPRILIGSNHINDSALSLPINDLVPPSFPQNNLVQGTVIFQSISPQRVTFTFSVTYLDGKVLSGTVNEPLQSYCLYASY